VRNRARAEWNTGMTSASCTRDWRRFLIGVGNGKKSE